MEKKIYCKPDMFVLAIEWEDVICSSADTDIPFGTPDTDIPFGTPDTDVPFGLDVTGGNMS